MRNYPKVLPSVPNDTTEYVSSSLIKRRSLPPQYFSANANDAFASASVTSRFPPAPPPRISSTLGRGSKRDSNSITTSPLMMAMEPPTPVLDPEISYNVLHVGPLLPQSTESIYSTVTRTPRSPLRTLTPQFTFGGRDDKEDSMLTQLTMMPSSDDSHNSTATTATATVHHHSTEFNGTRNIPAPRSAQRMSTLMRQTSGESHKTHRMSVPSIQEEGSIPPLAAIAISSRIPLMESRGVDEHHRISSESSTSASASYDSSSSLSQSGAGTVKKLF